MSLGSYLSYENLKCRPIFYNPSCVSSVFNNPRVQGKKTALEKLGEVVDILRKAGTEQNQQLAGLLFITRLLEDKGSQEKNSMRSDSAQTIRSVCCVCSQLLG